MFKVLVLQVLYNLSDEESGYQLLDWQIFTRFLGLNIEDRSLPRATTQGTRRAQPWLRRKTLRKAGAVEKLFAHSDTMLCAYGF